MLFLESAVKLTAIAIVALGAVAALRRQPAALRHWVLSAAAICCVAMPLLVAIVPAWRAVQPRSLPAVGTTTVPAPAADSDLPINTPGPPPSSWRAAARALAAVWACGAVLGLVFLTVGFARLLWLASRCREVKDGLWREQADAIARACGLRRTVTLLIGDHRPLLVTWGVWRPKIILPAAATSWSRERARIVLAHELAHVRRGDWLMQLLAELLRCAYWFNPVIWIVCRRLRLESERACDDEVIAGGVEGSAYAAELLELARLLNRPRQPWFPAPAMARPSSLERRVSAMLNTRVDRRPLTRFARVVTTVALAAVALPVAALAQQAFSTFSGTVFDPSDALLPASKLLLTNVQTQAKYEVTSDRTGHFEFVGLPAGDYALEVSLPGFATTRGTLTIDGQDVRQDVKLQVASLMETVTVTDGQGAPILPSLREPRTLPSCSSAPVAGGIGGQIRPPMRVRNANPIYPANVPGARPVELVRLVARIRTDGTIGSVEQVSNGDAKPAFLAAAIDAVRQWQFDETLLNCVPIEVTMNVEVRFVARAQARSQIRFNLSLPNGGNPQLAAEDGGFSTLSMPDIGAFGFITRIEDKAAGTVRVSLIEGNKKDGRVLAEKSLRIGDAPATLGTAPAFGISIVSAQE